MAAAPAGVGACGGATMMIVCVVVVFFLGIRGGGGWVEGAGWLLCVRSDGTCARVRRGGGRFVECAREPHSHRQANNQKCTIVQMEGRTLLHTAWRECECECGVNM